MIKFPVSMSIKYGYFFQVDNFRTWFGLPKVKFPVSLSIKYGYFFQVHNFRTWFGLPKVTTELTA